MTKSNYNPNITLQNRWRESNTQKIKPFQIPLRFLWNPQNFISIINNKRFKVTKSCNIFLSGYCFLLQFLLSFAKTKASIQRFPLCKAISWAFFLEWFFCFWDEGEISKWRFFYWNMCTSSIPTPNYKWWNFVTFLRH